MLLEFRARTAAVLAALTVTGTAGACLAQPDVSAVRLRSLQAQHVLQLHLEQREHRAGLGAESAQSDRRLRQRHDLERIDQRQLQQRQLRQQRALRQRLRVSRDPRAAALLSLQLQTFERQQRARRLGFTVQRRRISR